MDMQLRAIAVDLDFMQPSGTIGRAISQDRITWIDECGEWRALRAKDSSDNSAVSPALQRNGTHPGSIAPRDSKRDSLPLTAGLSCHRHACFGEPTSQVWNRAFRQSVAHTCANYFPDEPSFSVPRPSNVSSTSSSSACRTRQRGFREMALIEGLNFRCMPDKCRPTILGSCRGEPNG